MTTTQACDPMRPRPFRISRLRRETLDTFTFELEPEKETTRAKTLASEPSVVPTSNGHSFPFSPGQFNMLYVFGGGEVPISISGDPAQPRMLVHTIRAVGTVTKQMSNLKRGDSIGIRGPYGTGWPVDDARGSDVVIVAGGIGLAPLRPALYHILSQRALYGKVVLLYGARTPEDILYRRELGQWRAQFDLDVQVTVDHAGVTWHGNVGVVTTLISRAHFDPLSTVAMVCGPEVMMRFTALGLQARGITPDRIYVSMERNMKCGVGLCGRCQLGPMFVCKNGPVFPEIRIKELMAHWEV